MSALDTLINATPGLIVHMPLTDAAGAPTPAKAGPSAGVLTTSWGAGAVIGAAAFVPGDAFNAQFPNVASAFARIASHADILQAGDFAAEGFFQPDAAVSATLQGNAHILSTIGATGTFGAQVIDSASATFNATSTTGIAYQANDVIHLVVQRWGGRVMVFANGLPVFTRGNMILATRNSSSNWTVGGSSLGLGFKAGHIAYYSRALTPGEIRQRAELGGITVAISGLQDRSANARGRVLALGSTVYDGGSGHKMSSNEEHAVVTSTGVIYHPSSLAVAKPQVSAAVLTGASTRTEITAAAGRLCQEMVMQWTTRRSLTDLNYQAASGLITTSAPASDFHNNIGVGVAAAFIHRAGGAGRNSWAYNIAVGAFDAVIATQQQTSGAQSGRIGDAGSGAANYFILTHLPYIYLALYPSLPQSVRDRWKAALVAAANYDWNAEFPWYTNGNIEFGTVMVWWLMWQVTGDSIWLTRMEAQLAQTIAPAAGILGTPSGGGTFGWVQLVPATQADGSDGSGYFKETNGAVAPGLDYNYTVAQSRLAAILYSYSRDIRFLRYANMCWNVSEGMGIGGTSRWTKNANSQWTLNGTGGTRVPGASLFLDNVTPMVLALIGGRTSMNSDAAGMMNSYEFTCRQNYAGIGAVYAWLSEVAAHTFALSPDFPDIRLR